MKKLFRQLWWYYHCNRKHKTHPNIRNSWVEDLSEIDSSVRIYNSRLYGTITVGRRCVLDGCHIRANSRTSIGNYSNLASPILIVADINAVEIGKFCSLAPQVVVWESLHNYRRITTYNIMGEIFGESFRNDVISKGAVKIGNDVWVGTHTVILSGVTIGDGAVIGAGSVVSRDIPPYTIAAGAPAAPLRSRFPEPVVRQLQELRWWDWNEEELIRNRFIFERELSLESLAQVKPVVAGCVPLV